MKWTKQEIDYLKENYLTETKENIMKNIPNRTWKAIKKKGRSVSDGKRSTVPINLYEYKEINRVIYKKCRECGNFFALDENHFRKNNKSKDKFNNICRKCNNEDFIPYIKEGYRICKKCGRELPLDYKYFPKVRSENDFRHICRECNSKYNGFLDDDYKIKKYWSKEENDLFLDRYPNYTNQELIDLFYNDLTIKQIQDKAYTLRAKCKTDEAKERASISKSKKLSDKFKGRIVSEETRKKLSETKKKQYKSGEIVSAWKGRVVSEEERERIRERVKGKWAGDNNPRRKNPLYGKNNGRWNGGITNLSTALRENIYEWKQDSMKLCNYKCIFTGNNFDNIHHLYPFNNIIKDCLYELNLEIKKDLGSYDENDRNNLIELINKKHYELGLGVCICHDIHKLFHDTYSYNKFDVNDFINFVDDYFNGKYDNKLKEKYKSINNINNYKKAKQILNNICNKIK